METIEGMLIYNADLYFIATLSPFLLSNRLQFMQITYTSNYFQELYELAVELIRRGHAYVDHQVSNKTSFSINTNIMVSCSVKCFVRG